MKPKQNNQRTMRTSNRGFTLVEMLVAVALVLLMMSMFAQIFQMATGAMGKHKGLTENNQRARRLSTTLTNDLQLSTFRQRLQVDGTPAGGIVPLMALTGPSSTNLAAANPPDAAEIGYWSYSENDTSDETDDVLQFTIRSEVGKDNDGLPFFGKTRLIGALTDLNQPEADDGAITWNGTAFEIASPPNERGASHFAEVCYFLRNGNLYRRVTLIREALDDSTPLPGDLIGVYGAATSDPTLENYHNDFDYSAYFAAGAASPDFNFVTYDPTTLGALNNASTGSGVDTISLGIPKYRFGFFGDYTAANPGGPREFVDLPAGAGSPWFIGRFTHEETSNFNFGYPGRVQDTTNTAFNPYTSPDLVYDSARGVVSDGTGGVLDFANGPRRAEDIVLANVHAFDIKVFDDGTGQFENLGHSNTAGSFEAGKNANTAYGNSFDTWHVDQDVIGAQQTPFRPLQHFVGPDGQPGDATVDDDGDGIIDNGLEIGWSGTDDVLNVGPDGEPGVALFDDDGDGTDDNPEEIGWPGTDDVAPLRAIQITIRYMDISSNQMRDLTIIHSFADRDSE